MTPDEFRTHGHALIDWIAEYVEGVEQYPVASQVKPGDIRAMLPEHPPAHAEPFSDVLADLDRVVMPGITHWQHPSFFAYFPGNSSYSAILGELASAGLGVQGMSWVTSPACTEVETMMIDWMGELLGLPERFRSTSDTGGGVIHGSASEATLASILAARWRITGGDINTTGDTTTTGGLRVVAGALEHREGACASPASAPISSASCRTTTPGRCDPTCWHRWCRPTSTPG